MPRTWKLSVGIALVSVAVVTVAVVPAFGQRGGRRGQGESGEDFGGRGGFRGMGGPPGEFPGGDGFRGMRGAPGEFPGAGGPPGMFPGGGGPPGMFPGGGGPQGGRGGRGGMPFGDDRGQGRGGRGPFGGSDGGERLERFLREMDADGDGRIEENEVEGRRRNMVEMMAQQAGIPPTFPIPVNRLRDAINSRVRQGEGGGSSSSSGEAGAQKPAEEPLVPGFGVEMDLSPVLAFGQRPNSNNSGKTRAAVVSAARSGARPSLSSSSSPRGGNSDDRTRGFAEAMMRQFDRNRNGRLEPDEWNERLGDFREADRNHDGGVTVDELAQRLSGFARRGPGGERGGSDSRPGANQSGAEGAAAGSGTPAQPKSYRLPTPTENLPKGLPDWFAQKDANADGQVAMAEFESPRSWTTARVAEFTRFDLNNDGFITPTECLGTLNPGGAGSQLASAGPPPSAAEAAPSAPPSGPGADGRPTGQSSRPDTRGGMVGMRDRGSMPTGRGGPPGSRDRGGQSNRRESNAQPPAAASTNDAWAGF